MRTDDLQAFERGIATNDMALIQRHAGRVLAMARGHTGEVLQMFAIAQGLHLRHGGFNFNGDVVTRDVQLRQFSIIADARGLIRLGEEPTATVADPQLWVVLERDGEDLVIRLSQRRDFTQQNPPLPPTNWNSPAPPETFVPTPLPSFLAPRAAQGAQGASQTPQGAEVPEVPVETDQERQTRETAEDDVEAGERWEDRWEGADDADRDE